MVLDRRHPGDAVSAAGHNAVLLYISKTHSVLPGYLKRRFGEPSRALSAVSFAFMTMLMSGVNMFAMAKVEFRFRVR